MDTNAAKKETRMQILSYEEEYVNTWPDKFICRIRGMEKNESVAPRRTLNPAPANSAQKAASDAFFSFLAPRFWLITMDAPVLITE